jgi:hypothetical protein
VAGSCEQGDEPPGSGAKKLVRPNSHIDREGVINRGNECDSKWRLNFVYNFISKLNTECSIRIVRLTPSHRPTKLMA